MRSNPSVCYFSNKRGSDIGYVLKHTSWLKWAVIITLRVFAIHRWPNCLRQLTCNSLKGWCIISLRSKPGDLACSCTGSKNEAFHSEASSGLIPFKEASDTHWNYHQNSDEPRGERARRLTPWILDKSGHFQPYLYRPYSWFCYPHWRGNSVVARHNYFWPLSVYYWKLTQMLQLGKGVVIYVDLFEATWGFLWKIKVILRREMRF